MDFEYAQIGRWLNPKETARFISSLSESRVLELVNELPTRQLNHIIIRGTTKAVGYLGADNQVEKVNPKDSSLRFAHTSLKGLYERCLDENQRIIKL